MTKLSHKELVNLGLHEQSRGKSLSDIERDFKNHGAERSESMKALKTVDYIKKREERMAKKEEASKQSATAGAQQAAQPAAKKSSFWFWFWLILLILIGIGVYLYFSGTLNFDFLSGIVKNHPS